MKAAFGLALVFVAATAIAESSAPAPDAALLEKLRKGGYVLYFRHAATDFSRNDAQMTSYEECSTQRNLSDRGRDDARAIGEAMRALKLPVGAVLASPYCRTVETAQLAFGRVEKTPAVRGGPVQADVERYAGLRQILTTPPRGGTNTVVVSHGNPFYAVAGPPYLAEGEAVVLQPAGRNFEVLARIRVEEWRTLREPR